MHIDVRRPEQLRHVSRGLYIAYLPDHYVFVYAIIGSSRSCHQEFERMRKRLRDYRQSGAYGVKNLERIFWPTVRDVKQDCGIRRKTKLAARLTF
jgi:hypothetical protein